MKIGNRLLLTAATLLVLPAGLAQAQTQVPYNIGSGTVSFTAPNGVSPEPTILGTTGYVFDVVTPNATAPATVTVTGVSITQTHVTPYTDPSTGITTEIPDSLGLLVDNYDVNYTLEDHTPMNVAFQGAASSIISNNDALLVYNSGVNASGDVSLNTTGTTSGNVFSAAGYGYGVDVEADTGYVANATVTLGADTISSVNSDGLKVYSGNGNVTLTSAANITGGYYGIEAIADKTLSVILSGTVTGGSQGSIVMDNLGAGSTLTLQTGAKLIGTAYGESTDEIGYGAAPSNLVLQGHGTTGNSFADFNSVEVQNSGGGSWSLQGTSSFSGALTVDAGGSLVQSGGGNTFASATNNGVLNVTSGEMLTTGAFANNGTVMVGPGAELSVGSYTQAMGATGMDQATIDPASIDIEGGRFGGTGTVIGDVTLNGATLQAGDASGGNLAIDGSYSQTGGSIVFYIDPNGAHGFDISSLTFTPGGVSLDGTDVIFDFGGGADPLAFLNSGEFDLDNFFKSSSGDPFGADFNLSTMFAGDTFSVESKNFDVTNFDFSPSGGVLAFAETAVPEPATWAMLLIGFGAIGWTLRRRRAGLPA